MFNLLRLLTGSTGGATPVQDSFARGALTALLLAVATYALESAGVSPSDVESALGTELALGVLGAITLFIWGIIDALDKAFRGFLGGRAPTAVATVLKGINDRFAHQPGGVDIEKVTNAAIKAAEAEARAQRNGT